MLFMGHYFQAWTPFSQQNLDIFLKLLCRFFSIWQARVLRYSKYKLCYLIFTSWHIFTSYLDMKFGRCNLAGPVFNSRVLTNVIHQILIHGIYASYIWRCTGHEIFLFAGPIGGWILRKDMSLSYFEGKRIIRVTSSHSAPRWPKASAQSATNVCSL